MAHLTINIEVDDSKLAALLSQLSVKPVVGKVVKPSKAPYGLKKDGTPRRPPGRPKKS